ncbi:fibrinogen-like YCDxxxxGGGW domain-containing protein [Planomonospora parontospora]|uniref:fibrinogen-like YCDxxxxGGGW domain-containing protein n=1 Tax=Planomonospora parontospora TaxID=58119 RepID=UPI00166F8AD2|nr:fibrinogen-like YCDxxxxGGGW domain-containing protein [Planomonospora parontospora]GGL56910.1 hypothetical protein GCM10014719_67910 [Planomonospora parontospora subsp. antibiotica]GII15138.1 hypothetical protein Ppa05_18640 [Planomonospora parontospora subsp. antibiotica]
MRSFARPAVLAAAALVTAAVMPALPAVAETSPGSTPDTAAPSCWAIKQSHPSSADGVYWLQTPALVTPQQFYCDMTTDGGGWVLIGRGRQGWNFQYGGQGTPAEVRGSVTGTTAFKPAALPGDTVAGLLDGGRVDALADGIRIRRAADAAGTTWQEVRWKPSSLKSWSWTFDAGHPLSSVTFDGVRGSGTTASAAVALGGDRRRLTTTKVAAHAYQRGFAYGTSVTGANNGTSHLWQNASEGEAIPFAQVFIRPRLLKADFTAIPASGLPASTVEPLVSNRTSPSPWGVTGVVGGGSGEQNVEVQSLAVLGDTLYVGGKFEYVQQGAAGAKTRQPYLAAFDVRTGEWKPGFRPVLNGQVWDIQAAGSKLVIAGEFRDAATDSGGLMALDPATGAPATGWKSTLSHTNTATPVLARTLDLEGDWIYVGGQFNRISGGAAAGTPITVSRAARVRVSDGKPDGTWKPNLNGVPMELDATAERVYFGGHFTTVGGKAARKLAVLTTSSPATQVAGLQDQNWRPSTSTVQKQYRQVIREFGDHVWIGGSEHDFQMYTKDTFERVRGNITLKGGDFQSAVEIDGVVYGSCHCGDFVYNDASAYPAPTGWSNAHQIVFIGAWDAKTGEYLPNFAPVLDSRAGNGPWELIEDGNGCLWFGGDMSRGAGGQWLGGFGRLCGTDRTAPATPANPRMNGTALSWNAVGDSSSQVRYEVLRDDRVVAVVSGTSWTEPAPGAHRYFVRAIDAAGNRSATTDAVSTSGGRQDTLVGEAASWRWAHDGTDQGSAWRQTAFDDSAWSTGQAELGFGDSDEKTLIPAGTTPRPITAYFRTAFTVTDPAAYRKLLIDLVRDDGAVVYVNGVEVARDNLPAGAVTNSTPALTGLQERADERAKVRFEVPAGLLVAGRNTVAVEVHQANAWSADLSFALTMAGAS